VTGCGLKEAKEILEQHESKLRAEFPDQFTQRSGCGTALIFLGAAIALLALTY